jgi:iron-sulfur cluster repair protein YtfE (RIC family)
MLPSHEQERQLLLAQHTRLRSDVEVAWGAARKVLASGTGVGELQTAIVKVERELLAHLADEEKLLEPVLANVDATGPLRVELLRAEHAHQRAVLAMLTGPTAWPASSVLAGRMLSFCDDLLDDMNFEDRELLSEKLFATKRLFDASHA